MKSIFIASLSICLVLALLFTGCVQTLKQPEQLVPPASRQSPGPNSIAGHVYKSDGKTPIYGAKVEAILKGKTIAETSTWSDGGYIISGLPADGYLVRAYASSEYRGELYDGFDGQGTRFSEATKVLVSDEKATTGIDFRLKRWASISGHVYSTNNKPIDKASVLVYGPHYCTGPMGAQTSKDGSYKVIGLNLGQSSVVAVADGFIPRYYNGVYIPEQATKVTTVLERDTPNIDLYLEWGGAISGRIYQPDGVTPNSETGIYYIQTSGVETPILGGCLPSPPSQGVETAPDGTYHIGGLLSGEYELMAVGRNKPSYVTEVHRINVIQGEETQNVDFVLGPRASMSGHVYYKDGKAPVVGATVEAVGWAMFNFYVKTDYNGHYLIEQMFPGKYLVRVTNLQSKYDEVSVSVGKETVHDIVLNISPK